MSDRPYDAFGHRFFVKMPDAYIGSVLERGHSIGGTATSVNEFVITASTMKVPFACKLVAGSRKTAIGASSAVTLASALICKSVGGTGTYTAIGTYVMTGTNASYSVGSNASVATTTAANLASGDVVAIGTAIGTIANGTQSHSFWLGFEELFN
jgi:hypothetical protein